MDKNIVNYFDYDFIGGIDENGKIKEVWGVDALKNSLKCWLLSAKGENLRRPGEGGELFSFLGKPMNENNIFLMKQTIMEGLKKYFDDIEIEELEIIPNYEKRYWLINIKFFSNKIKQIVEVSERIKNLV